MPLLPYLIQNGVGNWPDANKIMGNMFWLFAMSKGSEVINGGLERWTAATSFSNPADTDSLADNWTWEKGGTSDATADVNREVSIIDTGVYSLEKDITIAGSSDSYLRLVQTIPSYAQFAGLTMTFGCMVKISVADKVRVSIYDGTTTVYSSFHTGDGTWQKLLATITIGANPSELTVKVETISDFVGTVYVDSAFLYITDTSMDTTSREALRYYRPGDPFILTALELTSLIMSGNIIMGGNKLTGLGAGTADGDSLRYEQLHDWDGWQDAGETWTYASASTFTVSGDVTAKYKKGTRLKYTQTTVKYAVVVNSSHSAGTTTVTILVNTDYTIANAAISANFISYSNPQGYPVWFNIAAPTFATTTIDSGTGGVQPTTTSHKARVDAQLFTAVFNGSGVKNNAGRQVEFTCSIYPEVSPVMRHMGTGDAEISGSVNQQLGGVKRLGANSYEIRYQLDTNIADNAVFTSFSWLVTYPF